MAATAPTNPAVSPFAARRHSLIFGEGEMADRTRDYEWSRTPVGPVETWPDALLITVNIILSSRHPMLLMWGPDLVQFYNDAFSNSLRTDKHPRALGQRGIECWPEIWPIIGPQIEGVMQRGEATWHENQLVPILRDGKLEDVYWTYSYSPIRTSDGNIAGMMVVCTETTLKHTTEMTLRQEVQRLADLFEQAPAFFAVLRGPDHVFDRTNRPYQQLIGDRDIIGRSVVESIPEVKQQGFIDILDTVYRTGTPFIGSGTSLKLARPGSHELEERTLDFVYQPMRDANDQISGILVFGVDVTEKRRAEQALLQTEKLAVVGRLASSIAHEINNPLEAITNLLYLAQRASISPEAKEYLAEAEFELQRVSAIATQTLRFYRQSTKPRSVRPGDLIDSTLPLYRGRLANCGISLEMRDRATRSVMCFEGEIRQVLSNLISNAIDSIGAHGGRLLIRTRNATDWRTGRHGVAITVADSGSGISPETQARIFEAFFTTKGASGTGLGLWITHEIVVRHGGTLTLRSSQLAQRSGTLFALFLPVE
ncbi:MAG TPA: ATP-binding protein [Acidobacteriaceae bacterium]|jgi:signal transduction histidine kinase